MQLVIATDLVKKINCVSLFFPSVILHTLFRLFSSFAYIYTFVQKLSMVGNKETLKDKWDTAYIRDTEDT